MAPTKIRIAAAILTTMVPALSACSPVNPENTVSTENIIVRDHRTPIALSISSCFIEPIILIATPMRAHAAATFISIVPGSEPPNLIRPVITRFRRTNTIIIPMNLRIVAIPLPSSVSGIPAISLTTRTINPTAAAIFINAPDILSRSLEPHFDTYINPANRRPMIVIVPAAYPSSSDVMPFMSLITTIKIPIAAAILKIRAAALSILEEFSLPSLPIATRINANPPISMPIGMSADHR